MNFTWSDYSRTSYTQSSQRTRYIAADYLANRPSASTPIACFQVAAHRTYQLYRTQHTSYVIISTKAYMYLLTCQQLEGIVGMWPASKRNPTGEDRSQQFNTFPALWEDDPSRQIWDRFTSYRYSSLEGIYRAIRRHCLPSTVTSRDLLSILPRPSESQPSLVFGTNTNTNQDGSQSDPTAPKSRRGGTLLRRDRLSNLAKTTSGEDLSQV